MQSMIVLMTFIGSKHLFFSMKFTSTVLPIGCSTGRIHYFYFSVFVLRSIIQQSYQNHKMFYRCWYTALFGHLKFPNNLI